MNKFYRFTYGLLYLLFPSIRLSKAKNLTDYDVNELERNSKCYCKSGLKYKNCHLKINSNSNKIALRLIDKTGKQFIEEVNLEVFNNFRGVKKEKKTTPSYEFTPHGTEHAG